MRNPLNYHELIEESELLRIIQSITREKPMNETETQYGHSYYYGTSSDKTVSLERLLQEVSGLEIDNLYVHIPFCRTACDYCTYPKIISATEEQV
jgi:coproporphyrinogen III oxidase-like Fe-S oxidoreductase